MKYYYLIEIICIKLYGFKYSYLILIIYTQLHVFNKLFLFNKAQSAGAVEYTDCIST